MLSHDLCNDERDLYSPRRLCCSLSGSINKCVGESNADRGGGNQHTYIPIKLPLIGVVGKTKYLKHGCCKLHVLILFLVKYLTLKIEGNICVGSYFKQAYFIIKRMISDS